MHLTSDRRLDEGEREFTLGEIPGTLWTPETTPWTSSTPSAARRKTPHANLGGHTGAPPFELEDTCQFLHRHLRPGGAGGRVTGGSQAPSAQPSSGTGPGLPDDGARHQRPGTSPYVPRP
ncbi:hypothetical protein [Streptomyces buecherae]|uniref:hypothetical protein n=1 Tax=Streptomyces buecherae TaxID=2763006 RepID=UPI00367773A6